MVLTGWVMQNLMEDSPEPKGDPISILGDNFVAVTWANRCGGATEKRTGLGMRMLGRLEIARGWQYDAKHIPGVNKLARGRYLSVAAAPSSGESAWNNKHR